MWLTRCWTVVFNRNDRIRDAEAASDASVPVYADTTQYNPRNRRAYTCTPRHAVVCMPVDYYLNTSPSRERGALPLQRSVRGALGVMPDLDVFFNAARP